MTLKEHNTVLFCLYYDQFYIFLTMTAGWRTEIVLAYFTHVIQVLQKTKSCLWPKAEFERGRKIFSPRGYMKLWQHGQKSGGYGVSHTPPSIPAGFGAGVMDLPHMTWLQSVNPQEAAACTWSKAALDWGDYCKGHSSLPSSTSFCSSWWSDWHTLFPHHLQVSDHSSCRKKEYDIWQHYVAGSE